MKTTKNSVSTKPRPAFGATTPGAARTPEANAPARLVEPRSRLPAGAENLNTPKSTPADFPSLCFPQDRTVLAVGEVARRMRVSEQHVINLIENGRLRAVNLGASSSARWPYYRIPIEAWESYVKENLV